MDKIMRQVMRDMKKRAEAEVAKAKKRVEQAEAKMQIALDERNEADEALSAANYQLSLVRRDQENQGIIWKD